MSELSGETAPGRHIHFDAHDDGSYDIEFDPIEGCQRPPRPAEARCNGYGNGHWALETDGALTARIEAEAAKRGVFPGVLVAEAVEHIGGEDR